jgi:hypothetical protein
MERLERLARFFSDNIYPSEEEEASPRRSPRHFFPSQSGPEGGEGTTFGLDTHGTYNTPYHDYRGEALNPPYHDYIGGDFNPPYHDPKGKAPNSSHRDSKVEAPSSSHRDSKVEAPNSSHRDSKVEAPNSSHRDSKVEAPDHTEIQQDDAIQRKIDELKDLFSGDRNKAQKNLINEFKTYSEQELKVAKEYTKLAKNFEMQFGPSEEWLKTGIKQRLKKMPIEIKDDKLEVLFSNNEIDKEKVEKNFIIGLTAHFKQELQAAKELFEWAETFAKPFGSDEKWVQDGIKQQLAIAFKKSQIESDKPSMANAKLLQENIREALKDGIPATDIPDHICGRKVTSVSGKGNDCLIRALLKGAHPKYKDYVIEDKVQVMRQLLIDKKIVKEGTMLDLEDESGKKFIKYMENRGYLRQGRNLLVYQYRDGKIQCISITDKGSNKPPYAVLLDDAKKHFYAIEVPQKE